MSSARPPSATPTARTSPDAVEDQGPAATTRPGLVLLYSPAFRSLRPAYPFETPEVTIGRDPSCTIVLDDGSVSRRHARIAFENGSWRVTDLQSSNGTHLDGERLTAAADLEPLHELRIGQTLFKFVDRDAEEYAAFRIDGAVDAGAPAQRSILVGGLAIRRLQAELARIAPTALSCILLGETGTGKEVVAREIHRLSGRAGPFQAIHCAAIPHDLLESELFGYRRGAFTGAHRDKPGLIQQAHQGTLLLDEIGDMPAEAQVKLLRVLQSREVMPVGGTRPENVDIRVVCATHRDLYRYVADGKFRGDLFARLNEYSTWIPPLRERKEDVFALTVAFTQIHAARRLEPTLDFMMALLRYDWPFNVRELESTIKRAAALARTGLLEVRDLPPQLLEATSGAPKAWEPDGGASSLGPIPGTRRAPVEGEGFLRGAPTEGKLRELLVRHAGNIAAVARELGKGRMQVHRWIRRHGLDLSDYRPRRRA